MGVSNTLRITLGTFCIGTSSRLESTINGRLSVGQQHPCARTRIVLILLLIVSSSLYGGLLFFSFSLGLGQTFAYHTLIFLELVRPTYDIAMQSRQQDSSIRSHHRII